MNVNKKYEQWKAITESDFVTLFIKTWFTFIAVLRELNPNVDAFTADGMPRGDKPFLNAYKDSIMPTVQKRISADILAQELFKMYPLSMKKVMDVFPQYFFQTFYQINRNFNYGDESIEKDTDGKIKERYKVSLHVVDGNKLRLYLVISGRFRTTNYNESIKKDIDLRPIIASTVKKHRYKNLVINEIYFMRDFYEGIMTEIIKILHHYLEEMLPKRGYNQTVNSKIKDACLRLNSALHIKFEYNYKYPHQVDHLEHPNSYAVIYEIPFNGFGQIERENLYSSNLGVYSELVATKGVDWFASFVYALRNALFHEIINPLDEEWQVIFKSAYLILKQISDICISCITNMEDFIREQDNAIFVYAEKNQESLFGTLADYVELLDFSKIKLNEWKFEHGETTLIGWFEVLLKLQNGSSEDVSNGIGTIDEVRKGYNYKVVLDSDMKIVIDRETGNSLITISPQ